MILVWIQPLHAQTDSDRLEKLEPDQVDDDNIHSLVLGLNYYIHGDAIKLMAEYVHTWSRFREAHPQVDDDNFD